MRILSVRTMYKSGHRRGMSDKYMMTGVVLHPGSSYITVRGLQITNNGEENVHIRFD